MIPEEYISKYFDNELSPDELVELNLWLSQDDANAQLFARLSMLERQIIEITQRDSVMDQAVNGGCPPKSHLPFDQSSSNNGGSTSNKGVSRWAYTSAAVLALSVLCGLYAMIWGFDNPINETVANVTHTSHATDDQRGNIQPGTALPKGKLNITQGSLQLNFKDGASVILRSPAEVELTSDSSMRVGKGAISMDASKTSKPFTVDTPSAKLTSNASRASIVVDKTDQTDVHVANGSVEARLRRDQSKVVAINKNQATQISSTHQAFKSITHNPSLARTDWASQPEFPVCTGDVRYMASLPNDLSLNALQSDFYVFLIPERTHFKLPRALRVSFFGPGTFAAPEIRKLANSPKYLKFGVHVNTYILHLDATQKLASDKRRELSGKITFDQPILGVIASDDHILLSDKIVGHPTVKYYKVESELRGKRTIAGVTEKDLIIISKDRKTLQFRWKSGGGTMDQIRIITRGSGDIMKNRTTP